MADLMLPFENMAWLGVIGTAWSETVRLARDVASKIARRESICINDTTYTDFKQPLSFDNRHGLSIR